MSHYFTDNTEMHHNRKVISFRFLGIAYDFITDDGVFSKDKIDFGSELLLSTVIENGITGNRVLDLGCGYGILSVMIAKLTGADVTGIEVNPRSAGLCQENAALNKVKVNTVVGDGIEIDDMFDTVVTNPPIRAGKAVVYRFFDQSYQHLTEGGTLWVVIRKQQGAESAIKKLKELFGNCETVEKSKGYFILRCKKDN